MTRPFEPGHVLGCRALWPRTLARRAQRPPPHTRHRLIFEARALRPLLDHRVEALEAEAPVAPHRPVVVHVHGQVREEVVLGALEAVVLWDLVEEFGVLRLFARLGNSYYCTVIAGTRAGTKATLGTS